MLGTKNILNKAPYFLRLFMMMFSYTFGSFLSIFMTELYQGGSSMWCLSFSLSLIEFDAEINFFVPLIEKKLILFRSLYWNRL